MKQNELSQMQFDLFWMSVDKSDYVCGFMTMEQIKQWSLLVWMESRKAHFKSIGAMGDRSKKSDGGKKGGKTTGKVKARTREQAQRAVRARWDKEKSDTK